jgi:hypothetical protein
MAGVLFIVGLGRCSGTSLSHVADYDGDGKTDLILFTPNQYVWILPSGTDIAYEVSLSNVTAIPVSGDFDGDAKTDVAIFRPGDGTWWIRELSDLCRMRNGRYQCRHSNLLRRFLASLGRKSTILSTSRCNHRQCWWNRPRCRYAEQPWPAISYLPGVGCGFSCELLQFQVRSRHDGEHELHAYFFYWMVYSFR